MGSKLQKALDIIRAAKRAGEGITGVEQSIRRIPDELKAIPDKALWSLANMGDAPVTPENRKIALEKVAEFGFRLGVMGPAAGPMQDGIPQKQRDPTMSDLDVLAEEVMGAQLPNPREVPWAKSKQAQPPREPPASQPELVPAPAAAATGHPDPNWKEKLPPNLKAYLAQLPPQRRLTGQDPAAYERAVAGDVTKEEKAAQQKFRQNSKELGDVRPSDAEEVRKMADTMQPEFRAAMDVAGEKGIPTVSEVRGLRKEWPKNESVEVARSAIDWSHRNAKYEGYGPLTEEQTNKLGADLAQKYARNESGTWPPDRVPRLNGEGELVWPEPMQFGRTPTAALDSIRSWENVTPRVRRARAYNFDKEGESNLPWRGPEKSISEFMKDPFEGAFTPDVFRTGGDKKYSPLVEAYLKANPAARRYLEEHPDQRRIVGERPEDFERAIGGDVPRNEKMAYDKLRQNSKALENATPEEEAKVRALLELMGPDWRVGMDAAAEKGLTPLSQVRGLRSDWKPDSHPETVDRMRKMSRPYPDQWPRATQQERLNRAGMVNAANKLVDEAQYPPVSYVWEQHDGRMPSERAGADLDRTVATRGAEVADARHANWNNQQLSSLGEFIKDPADMMRPIIRTGGIGKWDELMKMLGYTKKDEEK